VSGGVDVDSVERLNVSQSPCHYLRSDCDATAEERAKLLTDVREGFRNGVANYCFTYFYSREPSMFLTGRNLYLLVSKSIPFQAQIEEPFLPGAPQDLDTV